MARRSRKLHAVTLNFFLLRQRITWTLNGDSRQGFQRKKSHGQTDESRTFYEPVCTCVRQSFRHSNRNRVTCQPFDASDAAAIHRDFVQFRSNGDCCCQLNSTAEGEINILDGVLGTTAINERWRILKKNGQIEPFFVDCHLSGWVTSRIHIRWKNDRNK